ncbi:MAG: hypothetical protein QM654_00555 [Dysgonamonadaceae bacterium]
MRKTLLILLVLSINIALHSQNENPFAKFGYNVLTATSSKGEFQEFHDQTDIVEIGSVLFNRRTNEIVKVLDKDETTIDISSATAAMSIDPLCEKYYWISPYVYCANNPIKYVDYRGDSISLVGIQRLDNALGKNYTGNITNDTQTQTGLTLTLGPNGVMTYAKDASGNPIITTTTDAAGNVIQSGSATARNLLIAAMDHADMITVVPGARSAAKTGTNEIGLDFRQIEGFINGTVNMDNRTLGWGMTLMHEIQHTNVGGRLSDAPYTPGPVVTTMNTIRSELNAQGGNYGQRLDYYGTPIGSNVYLPFSSGSHSLINSGIIPVIPADKFIRFKR